MTPLTCDQLNELLADILNDEMELHVRAEVEIHLSVCPHCGGLTKHHDPIPSTSKSARSGWRGSAVSSGEKVKPYRLGKLSGRLVLV